MEAVRSHKQLLVRNLYWSIQHYYLQHECVLNHQGRTVSWNTSAGESASLTDVLLNNFVVDLHTMIIKFTKWNIFFLFATDWSVTDCTPNLKGRVGGTGGLHLVNKTTGLHIFIFIFLSGVWWDGLHADGRAEGPWLETVLGRHLQRDKEHEVIDIEFFSSSPMFKVEPGQNDQPRVCVCVIVVTRALTCCGLLLNDVVPVCIVHLTATVNITPVSV